MKNTEIKQKFIIVDDNKYWYIITEPVTKKELKKEIKNLIKDIKNGFHDFTDGVYDPFELYAYPLDTPTKSIDFKTF